MHLLNCITLLSTWIFYRSSFCSQNFFSRNSYSEMDCKMSYFYFCMLFAFTVFINFFTFMFTYLFTDFVFKVLNFHSIFITFERVLYSFIALNLCFFLPNDVFNIGISLWFLGIKMMYHLTVFDLIMLFKLH